MEKTKKRKKKEKELIEYINHILKIILGVIVIILGIAGIFLPIIPGIILIIIGILLILNKNVKEFTDGIIKRLRKNPYNPFSMCLTYILGVIFAAISFYISINRGRLSVPGFLEKIILVIAFPTAMLGLTIQDKIPDIVYYFFIILIEFAYGFLLGWAIHSLFRRIKNSR